MDDIEEAEVALFHSERGEPNRPTLDIGDDLLGSIGGLGDRDAEVEGERFLALVMGRGRRSFSAAARNRRGGHELRGEVDDQVPSARATSS